MRGADDVAAAREPALGHVRDLDDEADDSERRAERREPRARARARGARPVELGLREEADAEVRAMLPIPLMTRGLGSKCMLKLQESTKGVVGWTDIKS